MKDMRLNIMAIFLLWLLLLVGYNVASGQEPKGLPEKPKTKLESFQKQTGAVVIKGYSEIGRISA